MNAALRVTSWKTSKTPAPATILNAALQHIREIDVREFQRLAQDFDLSTPGKQGAVRMWELETRLALAIAERLASDPLRHDRVQITMRSVVIVALYAYSLDVLANSQVTLFRRMVEYLERRLRDHQARATAMEVTGTTKLGLSRLLAAASHPPPLGRREADESFIKLSQIMDAIGASAATVFHAAAVAPTDEDFFEMVEERSVASAKELP